MISCFAHSRDGSLQILELAGREEWALSHLLAAGGTGCTSISHPGPRWSDYVFKLRRRGLDIATLADAHDGPFAGTHGRYILRRAPIRPAGGGMTIAGNLIADPAFRHEIEALHRLGARVTGELIVDLVRRHGPEVRARMVTFAALDPEALAALDALLWPPLPLYRVQVAA